MRPTRFSTDMLTEILHQKTIASLSELSEALGNCSPSTVHRKLKQLDYLSSYSHRGKYYTLRTCAEFSTHGLWFYKGIRFSCHGTLQNTVRELVRSSPLGYCSIELDEMLKVRTIDALAGLVRAGKLARVRFAGQSIYCSTDSTDQENQLATRRIHQSEEALPITIQGDGLRSVALALFWRVLNEKQRRLFAGLLSLFWGHGGDRRAADMLGLNRKTVRTGRRELSTGKVEITRTRRPGGGRIPIEKKTLL